MIDVRKNAECHLSLGVASGALFAGYAQIAAHTSTDVCQIVDPSWPTAVSALIGVRKSVAHDLPARHASIDAVPDQLIDEHASIDARRSAATADRMLADASIRVAHDASHNAVFPCHP